MTETPNPLPTVDQLTIIHLIYERSAKYSGMNSTIFEWQADDWLPLARALGNPALLPLFEEIAHNDKELADTYRRRMAIIRKIADEVNPFKGNNPVTKENAEAVKAEIREEIAAAPTPPADSDGFAVVVEKAEGKVDDSTE